MTPLHAFLLGALVGLLVGAVAGVAYMALVIGGSRR